jgi:hypothetical protein
MPPQHAKPWPLVAIQKSNLHYKRDIRQSLLIHRLIFIILFICTIIILTERHFVYLAFVAVAYFITDFIFPLHQCTIDSNFLTIKRAFLGGLITNSVTIQKDKIKDITNVDFGITTDSIIDYEYEISAPSLGDNDTKRFELYKISYLTKHDTETTIKMPLTRQEIEQLV